MAYGFIEVLARTAWSARTPRGRSARCVTHDKLVAADGSGARFCRGRLDVCSLPGGDVRFDSQHWRPARALRLHRSSAGDIRDAVSSAGNILVVVAMAGAELFIEISARRATQWRDVRRRRVDVHSAHRLGIHVALYRDSYARSPLCRPDKQPTHPTGTVLCVPDRHVRQVAFAFWEAGYLAGASGDGHLHSPDHRMIAALLSAPLPRESYNFRRYATSAARSSGTNGRSNCTPSVERSGGTTPGGARALARLNTSV